MAKWNKPPKIKSEAQPLLAANKKLTNEEFNELTGIINENYDELEAVRDGLVETIEVYESAPPIDLIFEKNKKKIYYFTPNADITFTTTPENNAEGGIIEIRNEPGTGVITIPGSPERLSVFDIDTSIKSRWVLSWDVTLQKIVYKVFRIDTSLTPNQYYGTNEAGEVGFWSLPEGTVTPKLATPANFAATATSDTEIGLSWDDLENESSYSIERSADGSTGWTEVLTPAANANSASDTGLTAETQYFYRIKAIGDGVNYLDSNYSPVVSATTQSAPTGPTVSSYSVGNINENQLEFEVQID